MRVITIKVSEINNGEEAKIDVTHSSGGKHSDLELETVKMLNEFLYMKVAELSNSKNQKSKFYNRFSKCNFGVIF